MVKETCNRCQKPVYPTDKVGPLKDGCLFHQGCFKCYICGTRLSLKSYNHNRNDMDDREVYCANHVPLAGPHDPVPHKSGLLASQNAKRAVSQSALNGADLKDGPITNRSGSTHISPRHYPENAGIEDMHIKHALKAQAIAKPYPKIEHAGARYVLDYDAQTRLELIHREQEDYMFEQFSREREEEEKRFQREAKEEWERSLADFESRYNQKHGAALAAGKTGGAVEKEKADLIRKLTIKRERRRETMEQRQRERERNKTAELVDKQAREMLELYKQARQEELANGVDALELNENGRNGHIDANGNDAYPTTPPPPAPPLNRKRDIDSSQFEQIDELAISVAQAEQRTFTDLIWALTQRCRSDVEKARAIYRWITVKNLNLMKFDGRLDPNTPMGLLRGIKYGTESYHVLFKRLCSYAGLHCVVIKGYSKSAGYQPGIRFDDSRFRNTWNAVFLDGAWRFVQCNWGARHLVNAKDSNGQVHTNDSSTPSPHNGSNSDNLRYEYDDHYFMTDPDEFIYEFFPQQPEWQLLQHPLTLRQFEELPFVRSLFFRYGLNFTDRHLKAVVGADSSGAATVAVNMPPAKLNSLIFHYNLRFFDNDATEINGVNLKRFVMQSVVGHSVVFRVHTPTRGSYLLDIFANAVTPAEYLTGAPMKFKSVCKFKVVCDSLNVIMVPLPECASGEWGPAKCYRLFGLIPVTHEDAIINGGREVTIQFRATRPLAEFVATLHKNGTDERRLQKAIHMHVKGEFITFTLTLPEEGQYGLDIYTRESGAHASPRQNGRQLLTHCCKYLINCRS